MVLAPMPFLTQIRKKSPFIIMKQMTLLMMWFCRMDEDFGGVQANTSCATKKVDFLGWISV